MEDENTGSADGATELNPSAIASLSRRGFLGAASIGAAGIGLLAGVPGMTLMSDSSEVAPEDVPAAATAEPLVAQVRNFATGEVSIMSGMKEVIVKDPQVVMRLLRAIAP